MADFLKGSDVNVAGNLQSASVPSMSNGEMAKVPTKALSVNPREAGKLRAKKVKLNGNSALHPTGNRG